MTHDVAAPSLLVFGGGWLGQAAAREAVRRAGRATLTSRDAETRSALAADGFTAIDPEDPAALSAAVAEATAVLVTAPPEASCPGLKVLIPAITAANAYPDWIGYVSSTAVYGDRDGGWAFEDDELNAASLLTPRRDRSPERPLPMTSEATAFEVSFFASLVTPGARHQPPLIDPTGGGTPSAC